MFHDAQAASAPAGHGLQSHGASAREGGEECAGLVEGDGAVDALEDGHAAGGGMAPRPGLVPEEFQRLRRRSHEGEPCAFACAGEGRLLGKEPVAGMDRVAAGPDGGLHEAGDVEVGPHTGSAQRERLVGGVQMRRVAVVFGEHGYRADAQRGGSAGDAGRDFAPIGDEELADGHGAAPVRWEGRREWSPSRSYPRWHRRQPDPCVNTADGRMDTEVGERETGTGGGSMPRTFVHVSVCRCRICEAARASAGSRPAPQR